MLGASVLVTLATAALLLPALVAFSWCLLTGRFEHLEAQARVILDERDLRLERPWESDELAAARVREHGPPLAPEPGEWGGWS